MTPVAGILSEHATGNTIAGILVIGGITPSPVRELVNEIS